MNFDHELSCRQIADVAGISEQRVREVVFDSQLQRDYETGEIDSETFVEVFRRRTGTTPATDDLLLAASDMFWMNRQIIPLVTQLKSVSFPMGILSNTCRAHWQFVSGRRFVIVRECFDNYTLSFESKSMKPDPKIYHDAIEQAAVPPGKIFFVDDRLENVAAAIEAGMDAHIFHCARQVYELLFERGIRLNL